MLAWRLTQSFAKLTLLEAMTGIENWIDGDY